MNAILSFFDSCNCMSKKKLIAVFGAIVIIAITFLYFENFYNITHHSKQGFDFNTLPSNTIRYETEEKVNESDILKNSILNDNKNNDNSKKCWNLEKFVIMETCHRCDSLLRSSLFACKETGYREILNCEKNGPVSRSCPVPVEVLKKHYWTFEFTSLSLCLLFTVISKRRKRYLDHLATERVRKQILSA
ncbi:unnamed protein product [Brachionus calyciflorus]|uniref:JTB n=1 Tax=Brachionus calyciflorus TaxID=104777 RepID=A0A813SBU1_9BILA|nr:unnamed protein product [Brachionus calyciflorus]